jgi:lipoprotein-anchoring transpeptidase ErfK/SrfK
MNRFASISRREFLKLGGVGLFGLLLPKISNPISTANFLFPSGQQGRVTDATLNIYRSPSFDDEIISIFWRDIVLHITGIAISEDVSAYNRVWYQINGVGYAYSGSIQPVKTILNYPVTSLPKKNNLAEVTVPFTDAYSYPKKTDEVLYRFYYETTHWVDEVVVDNDKNTWYRISDDKFETFQYVPANHLRLIPDAELSILSPEIPNELKRIEVRINSQVVIAYEAEKPVFMTRASTGGSFNKGIFATPYGRQITFHKRPSAHMAAGNLASNGFDLPGVPWVSYITESGVAFHGTFWHNDFGKPRSHGCINISSTAAKWIYRWTQPIVLPEEKYRFLDYGTRVDVVS